jgi:hypothetical protein
MHRITDMKPTSGLVFLACWLALNPSILSAEGPDLPATSASLLAIMRSTHFHPAELNTEVYRTIENGITELGKTASSPEQFLEGFNAFWRGGPYSHVRLYYRPPTVAAAPRNDPPRESNGPVSLAWEGKVAILTVDSMTNSAEQIEAAYHDIDRQGATKLIIDLRRNGGGSFGVVPLIGHLIDQPHDLGVFVTSHWYDNHQTPPSAEELKTAAPCQCPDDALAANMETRALTAFSTDMEPRALTSYRIKPLLPRFNGAVYVLTSAASISAAEIVAEALQASGRATVVGERTPGKLLQPKFFNIGSGFSLLWPIADYRTVTTGRIEGAGVKPNIAVSADKALEVALSQ